MESTKYLVTGEIGWNGRVDARVFDIGSMRARLKFVRTLRIFDKGGVRPTKRIPKNKLRWCLVLNREEEFN